MSDLVTIVTAFFDIGRDKWEGTLDGNVLPHYLKRDNATYFERFRKLTLDFGYVRDDTFCPPGLEWKFNTQNLINLFCFSDPLKAEPIFSIVKTNTVYVQGCHIVAPVEKWTVMASLMRQALISLMNVGLVDDDQSMLLMSYQMAPHEFKINYVAPPYWFVIFKDFNHT